MIRHLWHRLFGCQASTFWHDIQHPSLRLVLFVCDRRRGHPGPHWHEQANGVRTSWTTE